MAECAPCSGAEQNAVGDAEKRNKGMQRREKRGCGEEKKGVRRIEKGVRRRENFVLWGHCR